VPSGATVARVREGVIVCETYDSRETAEKAFGDATARAMARAGVDASRLRIEYIEEVT